MRVDLHRLLARRLPRVLHGDGDFVPVFLFGNGKLRIFESGIRHPVAERISDLGVVLIRARIAAVQNEVLIARLVIAIPDIHPLRIHRIVSRAVIAERGDVHAAALILFGKAVCSAVPCRHRGGREIVFEIGIGEPARRVDLPFEHVRHGIGAHPAEISDPQCGVNVDRGVFGKEIKLHHHGGIEENDDPVKDAFPFQAREVFQEDAFVCREREIASVLAVAARNGHVRALAAVARKDDDRRVAVARERAFGLLIETPRRAVDSVEVADIALEVVGLHAVPERLIDAEPAAFEDGLEVGIVGRVRRGRA